MKRWPDILLAAIALLLLLGPLYSPPTNAGVPAAANQYKRVLYREAQSHWGLDAPIARFASQIHQESMWRPTAKSRFASGLAQFTPSTAGWISEKYPDLLGGNTPLSPVWAIRALVIYDRFLYRRAGSAETSCAQWAFTLSAYNGGEGWRRRDQRICASVEECNPGLWFDNVELYSNRAKWAIKENRGYPRNILLKWEPMYIAAGWRGEAVCSGG